MDNVSNMCDMFHGASSFYQDLSGWDVGMCRIHGMFSHATTLRTSLQSKMQVHSFFEGVYRDMPRVERRQAFAFMFSWPRRRAFMLFLVNYGYLYSAHVASNYNYNCPGATKPINEVAPCDAIFDVEDIYRYICQFL